MDNFYQHVPLPDDVLVPAWLIVRVPQVSLDWLAVGVAVIVKVMGLDEFTVVIVTV